MKINSKTPKTSLKAPKLIIDNMHVLRLNVSAAELYPSKRISITTGKYVLIEEDEDNGIQFKGGQNYISHSVLVRAIKEAFKVKTVKSEYLIIDGKLKQL